MRRIEKLSTGEIYHVYNKSIADFKIFNTDTEYARMKNIIRYYSLTNTTVKFSHFLALKEVVEKGFLSHLADITQGQEGPVQIIAYCTMPTHLHLIVKQLEENGISTFMGNILNSYSRYFNIKHKRKGPLWEGRFKAVLVETDEQLLHVTRYIHLNPVTANIVGKPEEWAWSSYQEYLSRVHDREKMCHYEDVLNIEPNSYRKFVEDRVTYQRELAKIKQWVIEEAP